MATQERIHHGRNVRHFRELLRMKQETLAFELGDDWTQKKISVLESKAEIEPKIIAQIAQVLKVPQEAIENMEDGAAVNIISNTFDNCQQPASVFYNSTINPVDKWLEALEENKKLYERLLQTEREKVALLEKMMGK